MKCRAEGQEVTKKSPIRTKTEWISWFSLVFVFFNLITSHSFFESPNIFITSLLLWSFTLLIHAVSKYQMFNDICIFILDEIFHNTRETYRCPVGSISNFDKTVIDIFVDIFIPTENNKCIKDILYCLYSIFFWKMWCTENPKRI